jgi:hypothetical protein
LPVATQEGLWCGAPGLGSAHTMRALRAVVLRQVSRQALWWTHGQLGWRAFARLQRRGLVLLGESSRVLGLTRATPRPARVAKDHLEAAAAAACYSD